MAWWLQGDLQPFAHFRSRQGCARIWLLAGTGLGVGNKAKPAENRSLVGSPQGGKKPLTKAFWRLIMRITKWVSRRKSAYPGKKEGVAP